MPLYALLAQRVTDRELKKGQEPTGGLAPSRPADMIFAKGSRFAIAPRGEAGCHSSSVSFTSFRATQG